MKFKSILLILILQIFCYHTAFAQQRGVENQPVTKLPAKEKRWALIIGVDAYQKDISPLYGTVNDAKALRDVLIKYAGFADERIILMTTDSDDADLKPTRGNIIDQLDKLQRVVPEDGLILFSFSGHGVSIGSDAFIVPSDGRIYQDADLMSESSINVLRIKRAIQNTKVKQVIMFLDACRNDPVRAKGDADNNLTTAYAKGFSFETKNQNIEAFATLYATSFGERAYEFLDKKTNKYRGYFSYAIEEGLKGKAANDKGEVTLESLIRYTKDTVKDRVRINENQRQIPFPMVDGFGNDLVIAVAERNTPNTTNPNSGESAFWSLIENSIEIKDFENYLARVTSGEFSGIYKATAELKLARLKKANSAIVWKELLPKAKLFLKYNDVGEFSEGLAKASLKGKYGFIDKTGKEVITPKYDVVESFSEGLAKVRIREIEEKYGFIDRNGNEIVPLKYDGAVSFSEGLAMVRMGEFRNSNWKYGFIDKTGKEVIPLKYFTASSFSYGLALVCLIDKCFIIDKTENIKKNLKDGFRNCGINNLPSEGVFGFEEVARCGYINGYGEVVIPPKYWEVESFSEGLAVVKNLESRGWKYGYIDKTGKEIVSLKYDDAESFSEGLAIVTTGEFRNSNRKYGLIDKNGKEVIPLKYDRIWCNALRKEGFIGVWLNNKKGFVDIYGNEYFDF
jgi:uncharacterized caspase-like protein